MATSKSQAAQTLALVKRSAPAPAPARHTIHERSEADALRWEVERQRQQNPQDLKLDGFLMKQGARRSFSGDSVTVYYDLPNGKRVTVSTQGHGNEWEYDGQSGAGYQRLSEIFNIERHRPEHEKMLARMEQQKSATSALAKKKADFFKKAEQVRDGMIAAGAEPNYRATDDGITVEASFGGGTWMKFDPDTGETHGAASSKSTSGWKGLIALLKKYGEYEEPTGKRSNPGVPIGPVEYQRLAQYISENQIPAAEYRDYASAKAARERGITMGEDLAIVELIHHGQKVYGVVPFEVVAQLVASGSNEKFQRMIGRQVNPSEGFLSEPPEPLVKVSAYSNHQRGIPYNYRDFARTYRIAEWWNPDGTYGGVVGYLPHYGMSKREAERLYEKAHGYDRIFMVKEKTYTQQELEEYADKLNRQYGLYDEYENGKRSNPSKHFTSTSGLSTWRQVGVAFLHGSFNWEWNLNRTLKFVIEPDTGQGFTLYRVIPGEPVEKLGSYMDMNVAVEMAEDAATENYTLDELKKRSRKKKANPRYDEGDYERVNLSKSQGLRRHDYLRATSGFATKDVNGKPIRIITNSAWQVSQAPSQSELNIMRENESGDHWEIQKVTLTPAQARRFEIIKDSDVVEGRGGWPVYTPANRRVSGMWRSGMKVKAKSTISNQHAQSTYRYEKGKVYTLGQFNLGQGGWVKVDAYDETYFPMDQLLQYFTPVKANPEFNKWGRPGELDAWYISKDGKTRTRMGKIATPDSTGGGWRVTALTVPDFETRKITDDMFTFYGVNKDPIWRTEYPTLAKAQAALRKFFVKETGKKWLTKQKQTKSNPMVSGQFESWLELGRKFSRNHWADAGEAPAPEDIRAGFEASFEASGQGADDWNGARYKSAWLKFQQGAKSVKGAGRGKKNPALPARFWQMQGKIVGEREPKLYWSQVKDAFDTRTELAPWMTPDEARRSYAAFQKGYLQGVKEAEKQSKGRKSNPRPKYKVRYSNDKNGNRLVHAMAMWQPYPRWVRVSEQQANEYLASGKAVVEGSGASGDTAYKNPRGCKSNPEPAAAQLYETFHQTPATGVTEYEETTHYHSYLSQLGKLVELKVVMLYGPNAPKGKTVKEVTLDFTGMGTVLSSNEDGNQLYFVGGDQSLDLDALGLGGTYVRDSMAIGILTEVTYHTKKGFDKFQPTDYYHALGEETHEQPILTYDTLNKRLSVVGGHYKIEYRGIVN